MFERTWGDPYNSQNPILFFHGLPGIKSNQNQDLAAFVHENTHKDILLPYGEGLGRRPGTFTFTREIENKLSLLASLSKSTNLTLVGHSWGGLQALQLAQSSYADKIQRIVLMSPLMGVMPRNEIDEILTLLATDHPEVNFATRSDLLEDAQKFDHAYIEKVIPNIPKHIHITYLQAAVDPITPPERAKGLLPLFRSQPKYLELDSDHQFLINRPLVLQTVLDALVT